MSWVLLLAGLQSDRPVIDEKAILRWIETLSSEDIDQRSEASRRLLEFGEPALPYLTEALEHQDPEVRERCRATIRHYEFEPGARGLARVGVDVPELRPDPERMREYESLAEAGKLSELLEKDHFWIPYAIHGLLSDRRLVAKGSVQLIHEIVKKRAISDVSGDIVSTGNFRDYRSAGSRAAQYAIWAQWWFRASSRRTVAEWEMGPSAAAENWMDILNTMRGGRFEDTSTVEHHILQRVKAMGSSAYPCLIRYVDYEDAAISQSTLNVLKTLTGREAKPGSRAEVKADWEAWLKTHR
jgi:hypothetical protein